MPIANTPPPFLSLVARDLVERFGDDLSRVTVVLPSVRARLYFNKYLYEQIGKPFWAPRYCSLDSLFEEACPLHRADSIQLVNELYKAYIEVYNAHAETPSSETLDEFYFFGEILLNDFDDIDKQLANARLLFTNLQDIDRLKDDFTHLSENQLDALKQHFRQAFEGETALKQAFWSIWSILGEVYLRFKENLEAKGWAYPGMIARRVMEDETIAFPGQHYAFVGFNVLSNCEVQLFTRLKDKALFYWDYDKYYLHTEAGRFIQENISRFGSALDADLFDYFLRSEKEITFLTSPSETAQSAVISPWITELNKRADFTTPDTAIVLCNETILPSVIHAIPPEKVENVNITMGFPITQTPVSSFLQALCDLQTQGYIVSTKSFRYQYLLPVLRHPYCCLLFKQSGAIEQTIVEQHLFTIDSNLLKESELFRYAPDMRSLIDYLSTVIQALGIAYEEKPKESDIYNDLYQESIFRAFKLVQRMKGLIDTEEIVLNKQTFLRLFRKILSTTQIPFHGEPVKGLQVMGVLETRTLDFDHLLMLNVNEGFMPGTANENTFIPQFLRDHFRLSNIERQDAVYAYYFYRLLQRARKVSLVYHIDQTQTGKAEISRFMLQLLIDQQLNANIKRYTLKADIKPWQAEPIAVPKTPELIAVLREKYDVYTAERPYKLSPTAINTFIDCSYRFYLQYVKELKEKDEFSDELDNSIFGSIFHRAAEYLYKEIGRIPFEQEDGFDAFVVTPELLEPYLQFPHKIEKLVSRAFNKEYFKGREVDPKTFGGKQLINYKVICHILKRLVEYDRKEPALTIRGLEAKKSVGYYELAHGVRVRIGGTIDRLDEVNGSLRVVDYKTGGKPKTCTQLSDLFASKNDRASYILQAFTYASVLLQDDSLKSPVMPALLYTQEAGKDGYSPVIVFNKEPVTDFRSLRPEFDELLVGKLSELFDPSLPFIQTPVRDNCSYCPFKEMCNRG